MAIISPFRALRPAKEIAPRLASRPYDVLNSSEAREEAKNNEFSFLHITKSEIDLPESVDVHSQDVYEKAKENLLRFIDTEKLAEEATPCYYIYQLIMEGRSQTGLVCISAVDDYHTDVIRKHEFTRPEKELDRINHMLTTSAQTGNVFLAYRDVAEVNQVINDWKQNHAPAYDFTADDGVHHTIWVINDERKIDYITKSFAEKVACTYIADGHHRAASAAKVSAKLPGNEDAKYFLTTIFPASELKILDYNRVVKDLNGLSKEEFLKKLEQEFEVKPTNAPVKPSKLHEFGMYLDNQWYILQSRPGSYTEDPIGVLDVSVLSDNILDKILGIKDQRTDSRIDFVGGIRGLKELENRVNNGTSKVAFSLYPVTIEQLFNIADSGNVMPPKSTWFEPKLRDGLLTHLL
jgi:uncharacterized protein (DUF1015 family)